MMSETNENPDSLYRKLVDVSLLLALGTGFLYFLNVEYIYMYFVLFGVDFTELPLSLPEALVACPYLIIIMMMPLGGIILGSYENALYPWRLLHIYESNMKITALGYVAASFLLILIAMALGFINGLNARYTSPPATVILNNSPERIEGYNLLKITDKRIYLFKVVQFGRPILLIQNADEVSRIEVRPSK